MAENYFDMKHYPKNLMWIISVNAINRLYSFWEEELPA